MNRDEFEQAYADKYTSGDWTVVADNRDGEGYTDHHIDLCWKVQKLKNYCTSGGAFLKDGIRELEW